jgi:DNA-binding CsgD family transcriptional regulator
MHGHSAARVAAAGEPGAYAERRVLVDEPQRLIREALVAAIDAVPGLAALDAAVPVAPARADAAVVTADALRAGMHPLVDRNGRGDRPAPIVIIADHGPVPPLADPGGVVVVSRDTPLDAVVGYLRADVVDRRGAMSPAIQPPAARPLTVRERQVLGLLASGLSPTEVARSLAISTNTARDHIKAIRVKLDRPTIMAAVLDAIRTGLLDGGHA